MVHPNHFRKIEKRGDGVPIFLLILTPLPPNSSLGTKNGPTWDSVISTEALEQSHTGVGWESGIRQGQAAAHR